MKKRTPMPSISDTVYCNMQEHTLVGSYSYTGPKGQHTYNSREVKCVTQWNKKPSRLFPCRLQIYDDLLSYFFFIAGKSACLIFTYWYLQQQMCLIWFCVLFHLSVLTKFILMRRGEYMFWWLNWQFEWNQTCTSAG